LVAATFVPQGATARSSLNQPSGCTETVFLSTVGGLAPAKHMIRGVTCNGKQENKKKQTRKTGTQCQLDSLPLGIHHLLTFNRNRDDSNRHRILSSKHRRWYNPSTRRNPGRVSFRNLIKD
jgi:hypothetical protein